ncbi:hypothetical protein [Actinoplanes rectilineatus]|uniref:hypothetical protein n=1 Tax=Actinoplanes rectilineatus TaxID=113571 RepID=UPI0005F2B509|nr:hypothetical protein [Actinoplanes rectilineatus]
MPHKTLYVRPKDQTLWEAAQRVSDQTDISLSRIVGEALRLHLRSVAETLEQQRQEQGTDEWVTFAADAA